jgi:hypothetical protein
MDTKQMQEKNWRECFSKNTPECVKNAIKRVYASYPVDCMPKGVSDPMYIMNVICFELGVGDGQGNFNLPKA